MGRKEVEYALQHPDVFSSAMEAVNLGQSVPLIPLQVDPPEHSKYRKLPTVDDAFGGSTGSARVGDRRRRKKTHRRRCAPPGRGSRHAAAPLVAIRRRHGDHRGQRRLEGQVRQHHAGPRVSDQVMALGVAQGPVEPDPAAPEAHDRQERHHEVGAIAAAGRNRRASADAFAGEHVTGPVYLVIQLSEGEAPTVSEESGARRVAAPRPAAPGHRRSPDPW
jgi:hypothetical protein